MLDKVPTDHILEKDFQLDVRRIATDYDWEVFCTYFSAKSPPGEPDLRLIRPPRFLMVELKRDNGKLTPKQAEMAKLLRACAPPEGGVEYYLWRPRDIDEVHRVLGPFTPDICRCHIRNGNCQLHTDYVQG